MSDLSGLDEFRPRDCPTPEHWPGHGSTRACGEGECTRCGLEQDHAESHEGEICNWNEDAE